MATPLKYMYSPAYFERLCPVLKRNLTNFNCNDFIFRIFNNQWPELELKARVRHITNALHQFVSPDFSIASRQLISIADDLREHEPLQGFHNIFLPDYFEVYGLEDPDISLPALGQITKLVSAEFAVRPFISRYPEKAMEYLTQWSISPDASVRRLSSEGCRPRLPWATALPQFKKDPSPILPLLENLKEDQSLYVRKSVANNINDIAKDHPDIVINLLSNWKGKNQYTDWILRHGCRSLLKQGHIQALSYHGFSPDSKAGIRDLLLPEKVKIGTHLDFSFAFVSREKRPTNFRLEYAIDYITASGKTSRKIFKLSENIFSPGQAVAIRRKQSFRDFSTRKHFKGKHQLQILANGKNIAASEFIVC